MKKEYIKPLYKTYKVSTLSILADSATTPPSSGEKEEPGKSGESKGANIDWGTDED